MLNNIYRAKSIRNNSWVYGNPIKVLRESYDEEGFRWIYAIQSYERYNDIGSKYIEVDVYNNTILKYTGYIDSEGNRIFEGDICIVRSGLEDYYYIVEWIFSGFQLRLSKKPESNVRGISHGISCGYIEGYDYDILVVGNIVDNKELIWEGE